MSLPKIILMFWVFMILHSSDIPHPTSDKAKKVVASIKERLQHELSEKGLVYGNPLFIRIFKQSSEFEVWVQKNKQFELFKTYNICKYSGKLGPKLKEGDYQSPEGFYFVPKSNLNPNSSYHLSFNLGFPNAYDRAHGYTGSALMVHGECVSIGCYAMTNEYIEEIYALIESALMNGQQFVRVHSFPFRLEDEKLQQYTHHQWYDFWKNLQEGYQYFEQYKVPPNVVVKNKRFHFEKIKL